MKKRDTSKLPPLEYRMTFYMGIRRQKCRFNPSMLRYNRLPATLQVETEDRWKERHPRLNLPDFEVSLPKTKKGKA